MRSVASLLFLSTLALAGCQSKAEKVEKLLARYNTEYPTYAKDLDETSGSARMLTGEKLTADETAELEGKKKERDTRCKPGADRLREMQREILAAQQ
jgi:hypothetical protein